MKTKCIRNNCKQLLICYALLCVMGCSDKYVALQKIDAAPAIRTSSDTLVIREKDFSNYFVGAGFLTITAIDTLSPGTYLQVIDSTSHLQVFQDSVNVTGRQLAINQPAVIFVACNNVGSFQLSIRLVDRLKNTTHKNILVKVIPNEPATPRFNLDRLSVAPGQATYAIDASVSSSRVSHIVSYTYNIDGQETTLFKPVIQTVLYSGSHDIGLKVTDDLRLSSPTLSIKITIP